MCEEKNLIMPKNQYIRFLVACDFDARRSYQRILRYWHYYEKKQYKNIMMMDVSNVFASHIIEAPMAAQHASGLRSDF